MRQPQHYFLGKHEQHGAALLLMLLFFVIAFSAYLIFSLNTTDPEVQRQQKTMETLANAKEALLSWSVLQGDIGTEANHRPGSLPCPDTNFFGTTNSGYASGSCSASGGTSIGRFPWRSLGIEELRDANGEALWYAVSDNFRKPNLNQAPINSDTQGSLHLYAPDGTTLLTPPGEELVAVIFSAGTPLPGQNRNSAPNEVASYLDRGNGQNNTLAGGPFIAGPSRDTQGIVIVNDLVISISARELISAVEKRALKEAQNALTQFATANGDKYPNPARFDGTDCDTPIGNIKTPNVCPSDSSTCVGRLPEDSGDATKLGNYVAPWFLENGWGRVITYAVNGGNVVDNSDPSCLLPLKVDGQPRSYVIIAPGTPLNGKIRPSAILSNYLEDPDNSDAWNPDMIFSAPSNNSNDQLRSVP